MRMILEIQSPYIVYGYQRQTERKSPYKLVELNLTPFKNTNFAKLFILGIELRQEVATYALNDFHRDCLYPAPVNIQSCFLNLSSYCII
jgi:hypothetical protein